GRDATRRAILADWISCPAQFRVKQPSASLANSSLQRRSFHDGFPMSLSQFLSGCLPLAGVWGIDLIEKNIDDHSGDRNVKPKWQRPSSNYTVSIEFLQPCAAECYQNQGHNDNSQHGVRKK